MTGNIPDSPNPISYLLENCNVTKRFGGLVAVDQLDLRVPKGNISSLIGPNGAGKTTIFNVITGIYTPDSGKIIFRNEDISGLKPHQIVSKGIARTLQNIRLFKDMTCLENVMAGQHCRSRSGLLSSLIHSKHQKEEERTIRAEAEKRLEQVGLWGLRHELAKNISYGSQRLLEIARALASRPSLLILDEPSSGLNDKETDDLIQLLASFMEEDLTLLLIEHDMKVVMGISDWVTVVDEGRKIAEGKPFQIYKNPLVIEAYLGQEEEDDHS
jgi:ABC-type branched-subunit amino acid transport system ATPase component